MAMDWNRVEGNWKQFKGAAKEKWGKLTDDDLNVIEGRREQLEGKLQQRYGFAKDQIHKDVDDWFKTLKSVQATGQRKSPVILRGFFLRRVSEFVIANQPVSARRRPDAPSRTPKCISAAKSPRR